MRLCGSSFRTEWHLCGKRYPTYLLPRGEAIPFTSAWICSAPCAHVPPVWAVKRPPRFFILWSGGWTRTAGSSMSLQKTCPLWLCMKMWRISPSWWGTAIWPSPPPELPSTSCALWAFPLSALPWPTISLPPPEPLRMPEPSPAPEIFGKIPEKS